MLVAILERHKGVDGLAGELVGNADNSSLGNGVVLDESGLDLGRRQAVAADVDDIVDTSTDPVKALVVTSSAITGELKSLKLIYTVRLASKGGGFLT